MFLLVAWRVFRDFLLSILADAFVKSVIPHGVTHAQVAIIVLLILVAATIINTLVRHRNGGRDSAAANS